MTTDYPDSIVATGNARRNRVLAEDHNGLDSVEVNGDPRQLTLMFLEQIPDTISAANIRIDAPPGQPELVVTGVRRSGGSDPRRREHLLAELNAAGGAGSYRVTIVEPGADGRPSHTPLRSLDPRFTSRTVRFDIDAPARPALPGTGATVSPRSEAPSYLARDYAGLRQLLLDRLAQTAPDWAEPHVPDVLVTLVELFAYLGDDLSYYQDAVATEAYLATARRRTSIRRHARLIGYPFHDGCHARAWLDLTVSADCQLALDTTTFTAPLQNSDVTFTPLRATLPRGYGPGETKASAKTGAVIPLRKAHNEITVWGWAEHASHLPAGATAATLLEPQLGSAPPKRTLQLQAGDVVMFEELHGIDGGPPDELHRHPVRLTYVERDEDPLTGALLLNVSWNPLDALPFDLPVTASPNKCDEPINCAVARANLVLVGHGVLVAAEQLDGRRLGAPDLTWSGPYPNPARIATHQAALLNGLYDTWRGHVDRMLQRAAYGHPLTEDERDALARQIGDDNMAELQLRTEPPSAHDDLIGLWTLLERADDLLLTRRRRLAVLARLAASSGPLSGPLLAEIRHDWGTEVTAGLDAHHPASWGPAADAIAQDPARTRPLLTLADSTGDWEVTTDLVDEVPQGSRVKVEMDDEHMAVLRFNPNVETPGSLTATYLVGNGSVGNVDAGAISLSNGAPREVTSARNPLPATGGTDPESRAHAQRALPGAYLSDQPRALTPADYVAIAATVPGVRQAAAVLGWSGSRQSIRVAVQPTFGEDPNPVLLYQVRHVLQPTRRIGHDLRVTGPDYLPIAVELRVTLDSHTARDDARSQLSTALGSGLREDGRPAFFHPSNFGFGMPLYASALIAVVQELTGVDAVELTRLRLMTSTDPGVPAPQQIAATPTGIIRCDNDPATPTHGLVRLKLMGGR